METESNNFSPQNSSLVHLPTDLMPYSHAYPDYRSHQAETPFPASKPTDLTAHKLILSTFPPIEVEGELTLKLLFGYVNVCPISC